METDELTRLKYIGEARARLLRRNGITTVAALRQTPYEELAAIRTIGAYNARKLKAEAEAFDARRQDEKSPAADEAVADISAERGGKVASSTVRQDGKSERPAPIDRKLAEQTKRLRGQLKRTNEILKPLWKKKFLCDYLDFKKRAKKLNVQLDLLDQSPERFPPKSKKRILKNAKALTTVLKGARRKPKKKQYRRVNRELGAFTKLIRCSRTRSAA
jgi:hypothetical protein